MATKDALIAEEGNNFGGSGSGDIATFDKVNSPFKSQQKFYFLQNAEVVNFELEPKPIGLTKEQLEKYRNDPFWKPVRTLRFVLARMGFDVRRCHRYRRFVTKVCREAEA